MARYTGPANKQARRVGFSILENGKDLKRPYGPGQHGKDRKRKPSNYAVQLNEKQKVKFIYGVLEKPFRKYYVMATKKHGITGEELLSILETRLDNVVYRLGFAESRREARQFVLHGHFTLNGKKVTYLPVDANRCDWATKFSLVSEEGNMFTGNYTDVPCPDKVTVENLDAALRTMDPVLKFRPVTGEKCVVNCPLR